MAKQTDIRFAEGITAEEKKSVKELIEGRTNVVAFKNLKTGAIQRLSDTKSVRHHLKINEKGFKLLYPIVSDDQKKKQ